MNQLEQNITEEEGFRAMPYNDTVGILTVGYGYNLIANPQHLTKEEIDSIKKHGITQGRAQELLDKEINDVEVKLEKEIPWIKDLDEVRYSVLVDMAYNLGPVGLLKWKNTLSLVKSSDYIGAAAEMKNSKWYSQVKGRGVKLVERMRTGVN